MKNFYQTDAGFNASNSDWIDGQPNDYWEIVIRTGLTSVRGKSLSENIFAFVIKKALHRHQLCFNLVVSFPQRDCPGNESSGFHISNLNIVVRQKTRYNLADKAVHSPTPCSLPHRLRNSRTR
jgi:hypothetical protein